MRPANRLNRVLSIQRPVQPAGGAPSALFAALDSDNDGTISKVELRKAMASLKKLDADNDGSLTLAECGGGAGGAAARRLLPTTSRCNGSIGLWRKIKTPMAA